MSEAIFPLLGACFVMVVLLPASALAARLVLRVLERVRGGMLHGLSARFLVLTGSTMIPIAWLLSAGVHQAETGRSLVTCLLHPDSARSCLEPGLFALVLGGILLACCVPALSRHRPVSRSTSDRARAALLRIEDVIASTPALAGVQRRVAVTEAPGFAAATTGLLRPSIVMGACYVENLDDSALAAALAHEAEHVRWADPLRYRLLQLALAANPVGRWLLRGEAASWLRAHEAHCDREAVLGGASPLPLAAAILAAARPATTDPGVGAPDMAALRFRVQLLCAFAEAPPKRCCPGRRPVFTVSVALLLLALTLPHQAGTSALDVLHEGAERAASFLWR